MILQRYGQRGQAGVCVAGRLEGPIRGGGPQTWGLKGATCSDALQAFEWG